MRGERAREQTNLTTKPTHHVITMSTHDRVTTPEHAPPPEPTEPPQPTQNKRSQKSGRNELSNERPRTQNSPIGTVKRSPPANPTLPPVPLPGRLVRRPRACSKAVGEMKARARAALKTFLSLFCCAVQHNPTWTHEHRDRQACTLPNWT